jgi:hypothetical protein
MSDRTSRLFRIYNRLKRSPVTIDILKKWAKSVEIEISDRQLYRDLEELSSFTCFEGEQIIIYEDEKNRKSWKIEYDKKGAALSQFDINSYYLFQNFLPTPIKKSRQHSFDKFEALLYREFSNSPYEKTVEANHLTFIQSSFYEYPYDLENHEKLENFIWLINQQRKVVINDVVADNTCLPKSFATPITLMPICLLYHRGVIHVCMFDEHVTLFILGIEQIENYKLTNDQFDRSAYQDQLDEKLGWRFGVTENIDSSLYDISLHFPKETGHFVKNHFWHPTQSFHHNSDGSLTLNMHCGINRELIGWILMWIKDIKVLEPVILVNLVKHAVVDINNLYNTNLLPAFTSEDFKRD